MNDEQTNKTDTKGTEADKPAEGTDKPISEYDKTLALVKRREEASKVELEILAKKERMAADKLLSGESGGHVDAPKVDPEDQKAKDSAEYFKGTQLEKDIIRANKKDE